MNKELEMALQSCANCGIKYPVYILSPLLGSEGYHKCVCGICALELSNEYLGIKRRKFQGEMAEEFRQKAIEWRKTHES